MYTLKQLFITSCYSGYNPEVKHTLISVLCYNYNVLQLIELLPTYSFEIKSICYGMFNLSSFVILTIFLHTNDYY